MENQRIIQSHLKCFFQRRESSPARLEGQNPLSTQFLLKGPTFFRTKWHFPAFSCGTQMSLHGRKLARQLGSQKKASCQRTIDILNEFFKSRSEKVRQILVLVRHYFSSKQRNGNGSQAKSRNRSSLDRNRTKSARRLIFSPSPFPVSFASTLNVPMVHCTILFDGSCSRVFRFPHLRSLGTRQNSRQSWFCC